MANVKYCTAKPQHLTTYQTSLSRDSLKCGYYKPLSVTVVRETPLDESTREAFYHPAVVLLDKISKVKNSSDRKAGEVNG